ncbi:MAG TPA: ATP-binding protein [Bryobacteraceae bacterium]|nr:ATP-binding protein [Bryobacteraceae bacterium]
MEHQDAEHSGGARRLDVSYKSELESVDSAETAVLGMAKEIGFDEDDLHRIGIALREAMVNAVVHGNKYNAQKSVRLSAWDDGSALKIVIVDEGTGFEMAAVPDPLAEENLLRESGRGILLMQAFVDELQVRRLSPQGTEITMVKYLAQR